MAIRNSIKHMRSRKYRVQAFDHFYTPKGRLSDPCVYCGVVSDTMDHVPPLVYVQKCRDILEEISHANKYPACSECNSALGSQLLMTLGDRRAYIADLLERKYKKLLRIPLWAEDELEEVSAEMRRDILAHLHHQAWVKARIAWAKGRR